MPVYGMDIALKKKMEAKRNAYLEGEVQQWIESIIEEPFPDVPYEDALKNGVILCKLMNRLRPNAIPKYTTSGGDFRLRENISFFQNAARAYGLEDAELFQTNDLYEKRNIAQVTQCIYALSRRAQKKKFNGPILGARMSEGTIQAFTEGQSNGGKTTSTLQSNGCNRDEH